MSESAPIAPAEAPHAEAAPFRDQLHNAAEQGVPQTPEDLDALRSVASGLRVTEVNDSDTTNNRYLEDSTGKQVNQREAGRVAALAATDWSKVSPDWRKAAHADSYGDLPQSVVDEVTARGETPLLGRINEEAEKRIALSEALQTREQAARTEVANARHAENEELIASNMDEARAKVREEREAQHREQLLQIMTPREREKWNSLLPAEQEGKVGQALLETANQRFDRAQQKAREAANEELLRGRKDQERATEVATVKARDEVNKALADHEKSAWEKTVKELDALWAKGQKSGDYSEFEEASADLTDEEYDRYIEQPRGEASSTTTAEAKVEPTDDEKKKAKEAAIRAMADAAVEVAKAEHESVQALIDKARKAAEAADDGTPPSHEASDDSAERERPIRLDVGQAEAAKNSIGRGLTREQIESELVFSQDVALNLKEAHVFGIFDGMGGGGGDPRSASNAASRAVERVLGTAPEPTNSAEALAQVREAMAEARNAVATNPERGGTTAMFTRIFRDEASGQLMLAYGNSGDSRMFRFNGSGYIEIGSEQASEEYRNELTNGLEYDEKAANGEYVAADEHERWRQVVQNATRRKDNSPLTEDDRQEMLRANFDQFGVVPIQEGDRIMICSDGITGDWDNERLTDAEFHEAFTQPTAQDSAYRFRKLSHKYDDKSVLVIDVLSSEEVATSSAVPEAPAPAPVAPVVPVAHEADDMDGDEVEEDNHEPEEEDDESGHDAESANPDTLPSVVPQPKEVLADNRIDELDDLFEEGETGRRRARREAQDRYTKALEALSDQEYEDYVRRSRFASPEWVAGRQEPSLTQRAKSAASKPVRGLRGRFERQYDAAGAPIPFNELRPEVQDALYEGGFRDPNLMRDVQLPDGTLLAPGEIWAEGTQWRADHPAEAAAQRPPAQDVRGRWANVRLQTIDPNAQPTPARPTRRSRIANALRISRDPVGEGISILNPPATVAPAPQPAPAPTAIPIAPAPQAQAVGEAVSTPNDPILEALSTRYSQEQLSNSEVQEAIATYRKYRERIESTVDLSVRDEGADKLYGDYMRARNNLSEDNKAILGDYVESYRAAHLDALFSPPSAPRPVSPLIRDAVDFALMPTAAEAASSAEHLDEVDQWYQARFGKDFGTLQELRATVLELKDLVDNGGDADVKAKLEQKYLDLQNKLLNEGATDEERKDLALRYLYSKSIGHLTLFEEAGPPYPEAAASESDESEHETLLSPDEARKLFDGFDRIAALPNDEKGKYYLSWDPEKQAAFDLYEQKRIDIQPGKVVHMRDMARGTDLAARPTGYNDWEVTDMHEERGRMLVHLKNRVTGAQANKSLESLVTNLLAHGGAWFD